MYLVENFHLKKIFKSSCWNLSDTTKINKVLEYTFPVVGLRSSRLKPFICRHNCIEHFLLTRHFIRRYSNDRPQTFCLCCPQCYVISSIITEAGLTDRVIYYWILRGGETECFPVKILREAPNANLDWYTRSFGKSKKDCVTRGHTNNISRIACYS